MNTITIRRWDNENVIFSYTCEDNSFYKTLEKAVKQGIDLSYADLRWRYLSGIDMSNANLTNAKLDNITIVNSVLENANLSCASLKFSTIRYSDLAYINLSAAHLDNALLEYVNLSYSELKDADFNMARLLLINLSFINLINANLKGVEIDSVKIEGADFYGAKGVNDQCPKEGSFIGWKKCWIPYSKSDYIVKLEIPADAKRSSSTSNKCRCSKAKVLEIQNIDGTIADTTQVFSTYDDHFPYKIGETIEPDSFDDDFWVECSNGIHFFMNREDAVKW